MHRVAESRFFDRGPAPTLADPPPMALPTAVKVRKRDQKERPLLGPFDRARCPVRARTGLDDVAGWPVFEGDVVAVPDGEVWQVDRAPGEFVLRSATACRWRSP